MSRQRPPKESANSLYDFMTKHGTGDYCEAHAGTLRRGGTPPR